MNKVIVCLIARLASNRLPNKVLSEINGLPLIQNIINNFKKSHIIKSKIVICTTTNEEDNNLEVLGNKLGIQVVRGSVLSVVDRMIKAAELNDAQTVVRVTCDNLFTDIILHDYLVDQHLAGEFEYSRYHGLPIGVTSEVINLKTLKKCYLINDANESEYMTVHLNRPDLFKVLTITPEKKLRKEYFDLSIDTESDLERAKELYLLNDKNNLLKLVNYMEINHHKFPEIDSKTKVKLINSTISYEKYLSKLRKIAKSSTQISIEDNWYERNYSKYYD